MGDGQTFSVGGFPIRLFPSPETAYHRKSPLRFSIVSTDYDAQRRFAEFIGLPVGEMPHSKLLATLQLRLSRHGHFICHTSKGEIHSVADWNPLESVPVDIDHAAQTLGALQQVARTPQEWYRMTSQNDLPTTPERIGKIAINYLTENGVSIPQGVKDGLAKLLHTSIANAIQFKPFPTR